MLVRPLIVAAALLLAACTPPAPEPAPQPPAAQPGNTNTPASPPPVSLVAGQTQFGIDLYRRLGARPGNLFLSPASISMALGMVRAGAEGETAVEMTRVLYYPASGLDEGMAALLRNLPIDADGRRLSIANALWVQQDFALKPAFVDRVRAHFGGEARPVDFVGAPDAAIGTINRWAEDKTAGRIKGLLQRPNINERTRVILTNAVHFKADWLRPFQAAQTRSRPFQLADDSSIPVAMMRQRSLFRLFETPTFEAVELPYQGEEFSLLLFLPKQDLASFEAALDGEALTGWIGKLAASARADLELVVPKLELDMRASLVPELQALGMRRAFTDFAELQGMADARLRLSDVIHQTYLRVDEKGTEAAAATAALAEIVSMPRRFHADRPFFFVIRDNRTAALLFMGRIERPSSPS